MDLGLLVLLLGQVGEQQGGRAAAGLALLTTQALGLGFETRVASLTDGSCAAAAAVCLSGAPLHACSILLYLIFLFGYGSVLSAAQTFYRVPEHMMRHGSYWLLVLLVPAVSFLIDYGVMAAKAVFCPTPVDIAIERDRSGSRHTTHHRQPHGHAAEPSACPPVCGCRAGY